MIGMPVKQVLPVQHANRWIYHVHAREGSVWRTKCLLLPEFTLEGIRVGA